MKNLLGKVGLAYAAAIVSLVAGCSSVGSAASGERAKAQLAYDSCLSSAVRYADDGKESGPDLALIVAPMCYQQYLALEKDVAADMGSGARRKFEIEADAAQVDYAMAAIREQRATQRLAGVIPAH